MTVTIALSTRARPSQLKIVSPKTFLERRFGTTSLESTSFEGVGFVSQTFSHPVFEAAYLAFAEHLPLVLRPDDFWLMIAQGFARHVNMNSDTVRHKFVEHEDQITLKVQRDEFVLGNPKNDWLGVFGEFSEKIREHIGATHQHFMPRFSTTTTTDQAAFEVTLMDAMSPFFRYRVDTLCGIPSITLEGERKDWKKILDHTKALASLDPNFSWWTGQVIKNLELILECFKSQPDLRWWESFFKERNQSGGPKISGWITEFVPYLDVPWNKTKPIVPNQFDPIGFQNLPSGLSSAPFLWNYHGQELRMKFIAGHVGVTFDGRVRPVTGWAIQSAGA